MKSVWKFPITSPGKVVIAMPKGSKVLCVQVQHGVPCIWALCDTDAKKKDRTFYAYSTGDVHGSNKCEYIGTFQFNAGNLVYHVFEEMEKQ